MAAVAAITPTTGSALTASWGIGKALRDSAATEPWHCALVENKWTHLVATSNASARTLSLTVGYQDSADVVRSSVAGVVGWNSAGVLSVGESFTGSIDELTTLQGVLGS